MKIILLIFTYNIYFCFSVYAYEEKPVHMRTTAPFQDFLKATFSIKLKNDQNIYLPHGSGFYIRYDNVPYAITARHVVQSKNYIDNKIIWDSLIKPLFIRSHSKSDYINENDIHKNIAFLNDNKYNNLYFFHENASIDAAIFPAFFKTDISEVSIQLPYRYIQRNELVLTGEDVHIFGFPGPYGLAKGESVVRSGTVCFKLNKNLYLLDANTWPGDSGGMVISKPYFGVPKDNLGTYQWQFGGKLIGLYIGRKNPQDFKQFKLPASLEAFRIIVSGHSLIEMVESDKFLEYHKKWKQLWIKIKEIQKEH